MPKMSNIRSASSSSFNSLEEVSPLLRSISEKFLEFVCGTSAKEKEFQELASKKDKENKEAQGLALKYNEAVIQHNNLLDRASTL